MLDIFLKGPEDTTDLPKECFGRILLHLFNKRDPEDIAFIDQDSGRTVSYGEAFRQSSKLAHSLQQFGITNKDVISIVSENNIDYYLPVFAGLMIGAAVNPLNPTYTPREFVHALTITQPKLIFVSESALDAVLKTKEQFTCDNIIVFGDGIDGTTPLAKFLELSKDKNQLFAPKNFDASQQVALILLSSGTTGLPKCVMITHENLRAGLVAIGNPDFGIAGKGVVTLGLLPCFHIFGLFILMSSLMGTTTVIAKKFRPESFVSAITTYKINVLFLVPPMVLFLAKTPLLEKYDLSSLTDIFCGAAPLSTELQSIVEKRLKLPVRQIYGLTELSGGTTITPRHGPKLGSSGVLVNQVWAKVIDPQTKQVCGPNQYGELCFKGPCVMKGYMGNEFATSETIDEEGYLHTGDIGYYDEDKYFYIVDRIKDLIKYKGFQVAPAELEAILMAHDGVREVSVIGVPDEKAGEVPRAFIVKNSGVNVTEEELINFVAERVSVSKRLYGGVQFMEQLPKTSTGKVMKRELREIAQKQ